MNRLEIAREWMDDKVEGAFKATIQRCLDNNGIIHFAPDCVLMGVPCEDDPKCLHVIMQCSQLNALCRVLLSMPQFERVRWRRDFRNNYDWRERKITDFTRHLELGKKISK